MPYTGTSIALVWIVIFALLGLTASGVVAGPWPVLAVLAALASPTLLRRSPLRVRGPIRDSGATIPFRVENEGGAE